MADDTPGVEDDMTHWDQIAGVQRAVLGEILNEADQPVAAIAS